MLVNYAASGGFINLPVTFNGSAGQGNALAVQGTGIETLVDDPDSLLPGNGSLAVTSGASNATITYTGLTPVDIADVGTFTLGLPNAGDAVGVSNGFNAVLTSSGHAAGTVAALALSGTSGGVGFETVNVFGTTNVVVDATAGGGSDTVSITGAGSGSNDTNLTVDTGTGTDSATVSGAVTLTGNVTFNSTGTGF